MTILEALQWANLKLKKANIESPMLDAELLLASVLDVPRSWIFGHIADDLKIHHEEKFHTLVDRRIKHEPIAYLIGKKSFFGRDFFVDPSVLIPRPATETLVEHALEKFAACDKEKTLFVDVGTGSGAIAVTLATETQTPVLAIDIDHSALVIAKRNAHTFSAEEHIDFQQGSLLDPLIHLYEKIRASGNANISSVYPFKEIIICANLPYLTVAQMNTLDLDVRFEPVRALVAGVDGLNAYWDLFRQLKKNRAHLSRHITTLIEVDPEQASRATQLIQHYFPEAIIRTEKDLQENNRIIIAEL
jgi:release factor glutamine methyltransferase